MYNFKVGDRVSLKKSNHGFYGIGEAAQRVVKLGLPMGNRQTMFISGYPGTGNMLHVYQDDFLLMERRTPTLEPNVF